MDDEQKEGCAMLSCIILGLLLWIAVASLTENREEKFESKEIVQPEKVLTTDGKKVDTIYVYKIKEN